MSRSDDDTSGTDPGDTFALVGNEIRVEILRTLGDERGVDEPPPAIPFADLRRQVDVDVRSSQFNYHLQQLVGQFVEQTEAGYRLRPAGAELYRAMRAETFARDVSLDPFEAGFDCHHCEATVAARYDAGQFTIRCTDCEYRYFATSRLPPSGVSDTSALLSRVARHDRHKLLAFTQAVCPTCANDLDRRLLDADAAALETDPQDAVLVFHACDHCGNQDYRSVGETLLFRPVVDCFFAERDVEVTRTPVWDLEFAATDRRLTVTDTDPWSMTLRLTCAGDERVLTLDENLEVVEYADG